MSFMKRRSVYLLAALLVAASVYLLLPFAAEYALERALREQGFTEVTLADVDLEAFGGELRVHQLAARRADMPLNLREGYLNIDWLALARRHGLLQGLALHGLELSVQQTADGSLVISGLPVPMAKRDTGDGRSSWGLGINRLTVTDSRLNLDLPGFQQSLILTELSLVNLRSWDGESPAEIAIDARLGEASIHVEGQLAPFAAEASGALRLRIDGLDLARLASDLGDRMPGDIEVAGGVFDADLELSGRLAEGVATLNQQGSLALSALAVSTGGDSHSLDSLTWRGQIDWHTASGLNATGSLTAKQLSASLDRKPQAMALVEWDGNLRWSAQKELSSQARLAIQQAQFALLERVLTLGTLDWQGHTGWTPGAGPSASGRLQVAGMEINQPEEQLMIARVEKLAVPELRLRDADVVELDGVTLDGLALLNDQARPDAPTRIQAEHAQLGPSRIEGARAIALGTLTLKAASFDLERDAPGKLVLAERLKKITKPATAGDARAPQTALRFALAGLRVVGDSRIAFIDNSVQPPFRQEFGIEEITLGPLDSGADQWTPLSLAGRLGEYGRLSLSGKAKPLAERVNVELTATIRALDLQHLSAYTAGALGQNVRSGQLDSDITLEIVDDQLSGSANLVANKLTLKSRDAAASAALKQQLGMSLDSALNMLRDADDNIRLTVPVKGDIRNPDFDLSDAINTAMGKALQTAALTYVQHALQPYGALITLAKLAGKAADRVALEPMPFPAGSAAPPADADAYLDKIHQLLTQRPALRIHVCGLATAADRQALQQLRSAKPATEEERKAGQDPAATISQEQLLALSTARSAVIKRRLVDRGIAPERLFTCKPEIDPAADAKPRVDLLL